MTTSKPKKPPRLSAEQVANTMRTGEEWLGIHRLAVQVAVMWWACLVLTVVCARLAYVQSGQAVSVYTDLMRPMPPKLIENMKKADRSAWTPTTTRAMLPRTKDGQTWNVVSFSKAAFHCLEQPKCNAALVPVWGWWAMNQPQNYAAQGVFWFGGGLLALTLPALLLQGDMRRWRERETRQIQRSEREARRSARGRR